MKTTKYGTGYRCDYRGVTIVAPTRVEAMAIMLKAIFPVPGKW